MWTAPSQPPVANWSPSGAAASAATESACPVYTATSVAASEDDSVALASSCHRRAAPSCPVAGRVDSVEAISSQGIQLQAVSSHVNSLNIDGSFEACMHMAEWHLSELQNLNCGKKSALLVVSMQVPTRCEGQPLLCFGCARQQRGGRHTTLVRCKGAG